MQLNVPIIAGATDDFEPTNGLAGEISPARRTRQTS